MTRLIDADALWTSVIQSRKETIIDDDVKISMGEFVKLLDKAPTVTPDMEFAKWVTEMIFGNNEVEDFDFELFSELACRKLEKLGLVKKTESEWVEMKEGEEK